MAELEAIVADYLEQAATWDVIPAAGPCPLLAERAEARAMIDRDHPDPAERGRADRAGPRDRRRSSAATSSAASTDETPCVHDLLAVAAEFGDTAVDALRTVLACYEAMRASDDLTT